MSGSQSYKSTKEETIMASRSTSDDGTKGEQEKMHSKGTFEEE
jgi:hypothetical protein